MGHQYSERAHGGYRGPSPQFGTCLGEEMLRTTPGDGEKQGNGSPSRHPRWLQAWRLLHGAGDPNRPQGGDTLVRGGRTHPASLPTITQVRGHGPTPLGRALSPPRHPGVAPLALAPWHPAPLPWPFRGCPLPWPPRWSHGLSTLPVWCWLFLPPHLKNPPLPAGPDPAPAPRDGDFTLPPHPAPRHRHGTAVGTPPSPRAWGFWVTRGDAHAPSPPPNQP